MALDMRHYIGEQAGALSHILAARKACTQDFVQLCARHAPDRLYLIGSGTSLNAALAAVPFMEWALGAEVSAHAASDLPALRGKQPLVVFISQGGHSTNTLAAIEKLRGALSIALTGETVCRVNEVCGRHVLLACGREEAGPKTKGYTSTVLTLYLMALEAALAQGRIAAEAYDAVIGELDAAIAAMPENVARAEAWVDANADWLKATPDFVLVGKGQLGAVAREASVKLVETVLRPSPAYEFEEFLHGPIGLISDTLGGIYLLPPKGDPDRARMLALARYHAGASGRVLIVGDAEAEGGDVLQLHADGAWYTLPFAHILPSQLIGAKIPQMMGVGDRGMRIFKEVDQLVDIKYGHRA